MVQFEDQDSADRVLEIVRDVSRALTTKAEAVGSAFGPGAHCVICGGHGRWDAAGGVTLCQRHADAIERGDL